MAQPGLISPAEACALIEQHSRTLATEKVLVSHALGRVLAEAVYAERDQPPFDRVAMDGIAIRFADLNHGASFSIEGCIAAGHRPTPLSNTQSALEVMTGAMLPPGADTVIPIEQIELSQSSATIKQPSAVECGQNVHRRGTDFKQGNIALHAHTQLNIPDCAIAASANCQELLVYQQPKVMIVTTGDELVEPLQPIEAWQVRRSNVQAIRASLYNRHINHIDDTHLIDDFDQLTHALSDILERYSLIILSGGVSAGRFDYVPKALEQCKAVKIFHKINQRPGKPLWFGVGPTGQLIFGLPGNPVSTAVCMARYVHWALSCLTGMQTNRSQGQTTFVRRVSEPVRNDSDLWQFKAVTPSSTGDLRIQATHGSGDFQALKESVGVIEVAPHSQHAENTPMPFYPW